MNVAPMILRFRSGSVTPAQPIEERARRVDEDDGQLQPLEPRRGPARPRRAAAGRCRRRCTSADRRSRGGSAAAATVESTPPLSAQTTRPSPTCARIRADRLVDERRHRPVAGAAADAEREIPQDLEPVVGVRDLRMKQQRVQAARRESSIAATGALALVASDRETGRRRGDEVAVAGPHAQLARHRREERRARARHVTTAWPYSRCGAGATRPPSASRHQLHAVADAEHGHARCRTRHRRSAVRQARRRSADRPTK